MNHVLIADEALRAALASNDLDKGRQWPHTNSVVAIHAIENFSWTMWDLLLEFRARDPFVVQFFANVVDWQKRDLRTITDVATVILPHIWNCIGCAQGNGDYMLLHGFALRIHEIALEESRPFFKRCA